MKSCSRKDSEGQGGAPAAVSSGVGELAEQLLVRIAREQGPLIDRIDLDSHFDGMSVRELLREFTADEGPWPTEVRVALLDLAERGWISLPGSYGITSPECSVSLTLHGLVAAREVVPGCGRPVGQVTLRMKRRGGLFAARFDTGDAARDKELNSAGLNLAAFYVLAVVKPTKAALLLQRDCRAYFARLSHLGVGPRTGPGIRLAPSLESIAKAIERLRSIVDICGTQDTNDNRHSGWFLSAGVPEVRVVGATGAQYRDWSWLEFNLGLALRGQPFVNRLNEQVTPLTDAQVDELLHAAGKDGKVESVVLADAEGVG